MRTQQEMLELILNVAQKDARIRCVALWGSRADPDWTPDEYADFDIVFFVTDLSPYDQNMEWIRDQFGPPAICQMPEPDAPIKGPGPRFVCLMLFSDGNRIDLTVQVLPVTDLGEPAVILEDKDGTAALGLKPGGNLWQVKPPDQKIFHDCCNEFWWCLNNVAKGILRDQLPYAMGMLNGYVRPMLDQVIQWQIGIQTDFSGSPGKLGKHFGKYLNADLYGRYLSTYPPAEAKAIWEAVFEACALFAELAGNAARFFGFTYRESEEINMLNYLEMMQDRWVQRKVTGPR